MKNEIEAFEENVTKKEMMEPSNSDEEEESKKKGKKDKNRQNLFKIERNFIVNKLMKLAHPFYLLTDKETGLNKFR